ncbi:TRAP transporter small permease [Paracoccus aurantiacus]|uniref:TRAP transporter small permease protein n=1 Tax=Paracoccus aurantiacus TaxID=2599412 RepID=A0A5C6S786_9RHOB|nr:TRAP transporter small permease [Paracoccus aurantiacus]
MSFAQTHRFRASHHPLTADRTATDGGSKLDILKKLDILIYQIIRPVVVVIGLGVALLLVIGIVSRSVLGTPVFGLEEIMLLAIMWFYMMGAVLASREGSHLKADLMDVLTDNPKVLRIVGMIATVISILASLAFCYWAMDFLAFSMSRWQTTPVFKIPFWISQVSILLAAILLTAYLLRDLVMLWRGDAPVTTSDKDV